MQTLQMLLTVNMGKRLIARGLMAEPSVQEAMTSGRLLIVAGTTNTFVAQEALKAVNGSVDFDPDSFRRGITVAPGAAPSAGQTEYDLLIDHGVARMDRTVFDIAPELEAGDMIFKGANSLYLPAGEAGVLIGHPQGGTMMPILSAVLGRRVQLVIPVGLEKRVDKPVSEIARLANGVGTEGTRLCPMPGRVYTELDALRTLTGVDAQLMAAGGVLGAEGSVLLAVTGDEEQLEKVRDLQRELEK